MVECVRNRWTAERFARNLSVAIFPTRWSHAAFRLPELFAARRRWLGARVATSHSMWLWRLSDYFHDFPARHHARWVSSRLP